MGKSYEPRMHTAEHILNQTMTRVVGTGRCFSAHLNKKKSKCDYHFDRNISELEASDIVKMVNEQISSNIDITEELMPIDTAMEQFDLSRLPDKSIETIRVVRVGDFDACPCIGEHVDNTAEIGAFRLTTYSFDDGVLRLRFKLSAPE